MHIVKEQYYTAQKIKFSIKDFLSKWDFTEEILTAKLHILCTVAFKKLAEACFCQMNKVPNDTMLYHQLLLQNIKLTKAHTFTYLRNTFQ